jgi:hypothetical protein
MPLSWPALIPAALVAELAPIVKLPFALALHVAVNG